MNLKEYKKKRSTYKRFAKYIEKKLVKIIKVSNKNGSTYHLHHVQSRAKEIDSLTTKLQKPKYAGQVNKIEKIINDLAGCRIIFLNNDDVNTFLSSRIIRNNFVVSEERSKLHYFEEDEKYIGDHFVVKLKNTSENPPEFRGMWCEIQIQTILNHAWSETNHDIGYKEPELNGFGKNVLAKIKENLKNAGDQIIQIGHDFQNIQRDYNRLITGKEVIDQNILKVITSEIDNNERYETLVKYKDYVLPNIDDINEFYSEIKEISKLGIQFSKRYSDGVFKIGNNEYPGRSQNDIFNVCVSMLSSVSWFNIEEIFNILVELYEAGSDYEKERISKTMQEISEYNVNILNYAGFSNHIKIVSEINKWEDRKLIKLNSVIITICKEILEPTANNIQSSSYNQIMIDRPTFIGDDNLEKLRKETICILIKLYRVTTDYRVKVKIIHALYTACKIPPHHDEKNPIINIIQRNTVQIIEFHHQYKENDFDLLILIESECLYLHRLHEGIHESTHFDSEAKATSGKIIKQINKYKNFINNSDEFRIYKSLIGYEYISDDSWKNTYREDIYIRDNIRNDLIDTYINSINESNSDQWINRVLLYSKSKYDGGLTFQFLDNFLVKLGKQHPAIAFNLITNHAEDVSNFLTAILVGLSSSTMRNQAYDVMVKWARSGKYLLQCIGFFKSENHEIDIPLLNEIISSSKKNNDINALSATLAAILNKYNPSNIIEAKKLFIDCIIELTKLGESRWINLVWYIKNYESFISHFVKNELSILLKSIEKYSIVDPHLEYILLPIAKLNPNLVINYFKKRMDIQQNSRPRSNYDWAPYEFGEIRNYLSINTDTTVNLVCKWYTGSFGDFIFSGGKFLHLIYPNFTPELETALLKLIKTNDEDHIKMVLAILRNYKGEISLHNICKEIVKLLPLNSKWLNEIEVILISTGVLSGEFAFSTKYSERKSEILPWEEDKNPKVRKFVKKYIAYLDKLIPSEKKRSTQDIERRKHLWGADKN